MQASWLLAVGMVAGLCTSFSFVPQIIKTWRHGDTQAISKRMYLVSLAAYGLWLTYGLMIESLPVVLFNALNIIFAGMVLVLKLRGSKATGVR
jgi:MtN3 and saliva related transmembrane protein